MATLKVVGKSYPRIDGPETVTGRATYTVDVVLPSMLHAKLFRSSVRHACQDPTSRCEPGARANGRRGGPDGRRRAAQEIRFYSPRRGTLCRRKGALCW